MLSRATWIGVTAASSLLLVGAFFGLKLAKSTPISTTAPEPAESGAAQLDAQPHDSARNGLGKLSTSVAPARVLAPAARQPDMAPPSPERAKELVAKLTEMGPNRGPLTAADAPGIQQQFAELKAQGALALPAIREFLAKNQDLPFDVSEISEAVGTTSLRMGFLKVLQDIDGPEATTVAADTLKNTGDPLEIATLAGMLEKSAPGEHREEAVKAARDALNLAAAGQLIGQHIAPAFEVLQTYGDTNVIPVLQEQIGGKWRQNATIALAELPDGAGLPALIELAKDPSIAAAGQGDVALRPLAQVAVRYPQAADALAQLAQENKIPDPAWPTIISALAGSAYVSNGQLLPETRAPATDLNALTSQRLALLERLGSATSSGVAGPLIQQARATLMSRRAR